jgi:hypothetical protein
MCSVNRKRKSCALIYHLSFFPPSVVAIDAFGQRHAWQRLRGSFKEVCRQSVLYTNLHG